MTTFEGGCACGRVRYQMTSTPMFVNCCHCTDCQRQTGSAFVINALIEADRAVMTGDTTAVVVPSPSGKGQKIVRCTECQVALFSNYGGGGDKLRFVRVGTLDRPASLPPDVHIYTRSKLPWVAIPEGTPAFAEYYESSKLWPAESLARRKALFG